MSDVAPRNAREWLEMVHPEAAMETPPPMSEFAMVLGELQRMHDKKNQDYGREGDAFANVRASEDFGISPWIGAAIRMNDKMRRLQTAAKRQTLANESVEDSLIDIAVYSVIALILFRESKRA